MKKTLQFSLALLFFSISVFAGQGYKLDNLAIEKLFEDAEEISLNEIVNVPLLADFHPQNIAMDDPTTKVLVSCIIYFTGLDFFGIHRYILGTKPNMWTYYTFTCGGIFGIVPTVDFIVLIVDGLVNQNGIRYLDNEEFFMWIN